MLDGSVFRLADLRGKVVLIDFWATWCGPCIRAMPEIQKLHDQYREKGVVILGLSTEEKSFEPKVRATVEKLKVTYAIACGGGDVSRAYGVRGIPNLLLIGPDGTVQARHVGFAPGLAAKVSRQIDSLLSGQTLLPAPAQ